MPSFDYQKINNLIHSRIRLAIMSILIGVEKADFNFLKKQTKASDGNLSVHLKKLEEAEYIHVEKKFVDRKPATYYSLTNKGRDDFAQYVKTLESLLN